MNLIIATFALCIAALADTTGDTTTVRETHYPDQTMHERYRQNAEGERDGFYESYHPNGLLSVKGTYKRGVKTGSWTYFDTLGNVENIRLFTDEGSEQQKAAPPAAGPRRSPKQGVIVSTNSDSVEIMISGESRGKHRLALIELDAGLHRIVARRKGYCSDVQWVNVFPSMVSHASFLVKRWRVEFSQRFSLMHMADVVDIWPCWPLHGGVRLGHHYGGLSLSWSMFKMHEYHYEYDPAGMGLSYDTENRFFAGWLHYGYAAIGHEFVVVQPGAAVGVWWLDTRYDPWGGTPPPGAPPVESGLIITIGPELTIQGGLEHFKLVASISYDAWLRENMDLLNFDKNIFRVEWGFAWKF
jgi:hypothetical protein